MGHRSHRSAQPRRGHQLAVGQRRVDAAHHEQAARDLTAGGHREGVEAGHLEVAVVVATLVEGGPQRGEQIERLVGVHGRQGGGPQEQLGSDVGRGVDARAQVEWHHRPQGVEAGVDDILDQLTGLVGHEVGAYAEGCWSVVFCWATFSEAPFSEAPFSEA